MKDDSTNFIQYYIDNPSVVSDALNQPPNGFDQSSADAYAQYVANGKLPDPAPEAASPSTFSQLNGLPSILSGDEFPKSYELTPRNFIIDGLIQEKDVAVAVGPSKLGKTFWWLNCLLSISLGVPFLGRNTKKGNVLMIDFELREDVAMDRIYSICHRMGLNEVPDTFHLLSLAKKCYNLETVVELLRSELASRPEISCLCVDPTYLLTVASSASLASYHAW